MKKTKIEKMKDIALGCTITLLGIMVLNSVLAVWNGSNLGQKVSGDRVSLTDVNTIIGLLQNLSNDNGKIGIGTSSPGAALEVNGNIIADPPTEDNHVVTKSYIDDINDWSLYTVLPTTTSYAGNLGGLAGATAKCQAEFGADLAWFFNLTTWNMLVQDPNVILKSGEYTEPGGWWIQSYGESPAADNCWAFSSTSGTGISILSDDITATNKPDYSSVCTNSRHLLCIVKQR